MIEAIEPPPGPADQERLWYRTGPALLIDELGAAFDPLTGETHMLADLPLLLAESVSSRPSPKQALVDRLAGELELDEAGWQRIDLALLQLESAGIIASMISADVQNTAADGQARSDN